jgi:hypothetical protein
MVEAVLKGERGDSEEGGNVQRRWETVLRVERHSWEQKDALESRKKLWREGIHSKEQKDAPKTSKTLLKMIKSLWKKTKSSQQAPNCQEASTAS